MRYGLSIAIAAPRGGAKTTWAIIATLWAILTGQLDFFVYATARQDGPNGSESRLQAVKNQLLHNDLLAADFPEVITPIRAAISETGRIRAVLVDGKPINIQWSSDTIVLPTITGSKASGAVIVATSLQGSIRGLNVNGKRVKFVLIDDPQKGIEAASETVQERIRETIFRDIGGLSGHTQSLACVALVTIIQSGDIADELTDRAKHPEWQGSKSRALETMPERMDLWEQYSELWRKGQSSGEDPTGIAAHQFYLANRREMDRNAVEWWPDAYDKRPGPDGNPMESSWTEHCMRWMFRNGEPAFWSELQNTPQEQEKEFSITTDRVKAQLSGYPRFVLPERPRALTRFFDLHADEVHYGAIAALNGGRRILVDYDIQPVERPDMNARGNDKAGQEALKRRIYEAMERIHEAEIAGKYYTADGEIMHVSLTCIDGGWMIDVAERFAQDHGHRYRVTKGQGSHVGQERFSMPARSKGVKPGRHWYCKKQPNGVWLWFLDVDEWKLLTHQSFLTGIENSGSLSLFGNDPDAHRTYARHIVESEKYDWQKHKWVENPRYRWNHFLDCTAGCLAALDMCGCTELTRKFINREKAGSVGSAGSAGKDIANAVNQLQADVDRAEHKDPDHIRRKVMQRRVWRPAYRRGGGRSAW